jgi:hypothetical protein
MVDKGTRGFFPAFPIASTLHSSEMRKNILVLQKDMTMRNLMVIFIALMPALAYAQSSTQKELRGYGYVFSGPVVSPNGEHVSLYTGVGGEKILLKGFGIGGDAGYVSPGIFSRASYLISVNPSYHFLNASKSNRLVPFLTGGVTLFGGCNDSIGGCKTLGGNFGGGIIYWFKDSVGMRFEVRDHIPLFLVRRADHFPGFRIALTFR